MLRPGGRTAFFTIYAPRDLPASARARARAAAPRYGWSRAEHVQLLRSAGFDDVEELDRTAEYLVTLRGWYDRSEEHAEELAALVSQERFAERQRERRAAIDAVEAGLQRRVLLTGVRPLGGRIRDALSSHADRRHDRGR